MTESSRIKGKTPNVVLKIAAWEMVIYRDPDPRAILWYKRKIIDDQVVRGQYQFSLRVRHFLNKRNRAVLVALIAELQEWVAYLNRVAP